MRIRSGRRPPEGDGDGAAFAATAAPLRVLWCRSAATKWRGARTLRQWGTGVYARCMNQARVFQRRRLMRLGGIVVVSLLRAVRLQKRICVLLRMENAKRIRQRGGLHREENRKKRKPSAACARVCLSALLALPPSRASSSMAMCFYADLLCGPVR